MRSDPPFILYHTYERVCKGFPSVVWQQQLETSYIECYNKRHLIEKKTPTPYITAKQDVSMVFRPLPEITDYEPQFVDPH